MAQESDDFPLDLPELPWLGFYVLDSDNKPVPEHNLLKWTAWLETHKRQVKRTDLGRNGLISTIFTGLDHDHLGQALDLPHAPLLWETMVFGGQHDHEMWRYTSLKAALKGHAKLVEICQGLETDDDENLHDECPTN